MVLKSVPTFCMQVEASSEQFKRLPLYFSSVNCMRTRRVMCTWRGFQERNPSIPNVVVLILFVVVVVF